MLGGGKPEGTGAAMVERSGGLVASKSTGRAPSVVLGGPFEGRLVCGGRADEALAGRARAVGHVCAR